MFDWMFQSREEFLINYFDIGNSFVSSKELQEDHKIFSLSSMVISEFVFFIISLFHHFRSWCHAGYVRNGQSSLIAGRTFIR